MDLKTKMQLLRLTDSYSTLLPPEIKEMILNYKESQELIEWRENFYSLRVRHQIEAYGQLRLAWFIGPIQCKPRLPKGCQCQPGSLQINKYRSSRRLYFIIIQVILYHILLYFIFIL